MARGSSGIGTVSILGCQVVQQKTLRLGNEREEEMTAQMPFLDFNSDRLSAADLAEMRERQMMVLSESNGGGGGGGGGVETSNGRNLLGSCCGSRGRFSPEMEERLFKQTLSSDSEPSFRFPYSHSSEENSRIGAPHHAEDLMELNGRPDESLSSYIRTIRTNTLTLNHSTSSEASYNGEVSPVSSGAAEMSPRNTRCDELVAGGEKKEIKAGVERQTDSQAVESSRDRDREHSLEPRQVRYDGFGNVKVEQFGAQGSLNYRMVFVENGQGISAWHNLPLYAPDGLLNCVCTTAAGRWLRYEVSQSEPFNPIKIASKNGKPARFAENAPWNLGFLPQTWADPDQPVLDSTVKRLLGFPDRSLEVSDLGNATTPGGMRKVLGGMGSSGGVERVSTVSEKRGWSKELSKSLQKSRAQLGEGNSLLLVKNDGCPVETIDVGLKVRRRTGDMYLVKPLGAFAVVEKGTELSWKILVIDAADPRAESVQDAVDVEKTMPGVLEGILEWFRTCLCTEAGENISFKMVYLVQNCIYPKQEGDSERAVCFNGQSADLAVAAGAIADAHCAWQLYDHQMGETETDTLPSSHPLTATSLEELFLPYTSRENDVCIPVTGSNSSGPAPLYDKAWASVEEVLGKQYGTRGESKGNQTGTKGNRLPSVGKHVRKLSQESIFNKNKCRGQPIINSLLCGSEQFGEYNQIELEKAVTGHIGNHKSDSSRFSGGLDKTGAGKAKGAPDLPPIVPAKPAAEHGKQSQQRFDRQKKSKSGGSKRFPPVSELPLSPKDVHESRVRSVKTLESTGRSSRAGNGGAELSSPRGNRCSERSVERMADYGWMDFEGDMRMIDAQVAVFDEGGGSNGVWLPEAIYDPYGLLDDRIDFRMDKVDQRSPTSMKSSHPLVNYAAQLEKSQGQSGSTKGFPMGDIIRGDSPADLFLRSKMWPAHLGDKGKLDEEERIQGMMASYEAEKEERERAELSASSLSGERVRPSRREKEGEGECKIRNGEFKDGKGGREGASDTSADRKTERRGRRRPKKSSSQANPGSDNCCSNIKGRTAEARGGMGERGSTRVRRVPSLESSEELIHDHEGRLHPKHSPSPSFSRMLDDDEVEGGRKERVGRIVSGRHRSVSRRQGEDSGDWPENRKLEHVLSFSFDCQATEDNGDEEVTSAEREERQEREERGERGVEGGEAREGYSEGEKGQKRSGRENPGRKREKKGEEREREERENRKVKGNSESQSFVEVQQKMGKVSLREEESWVEEFKNTGVEDLSETFGGFQNLSEGWDKKMGEEEKRRCDN